MKPQWIDIAIPGISIAHVDKALERQEQLTKPPGSLGVLERLAVEAAGWQSREKPAFDRIRILVFAGDHGIAAAGVSAFPQEVTVEMVKNFSRGGAAICVLARETGAELEVVDTGTLKDPGPLRGVVSARAGAGTQDFRTAPAMTPEQLVLALESGRDAVLRGIHKQVQLFAGGEMGIGNTTAAAALGTVLTGQPATILTGPGTGVNSQGVAKKVAFIQDAIRFHSPDPKNPLEVLRCLGGFEIAALVGMYLSAAQAGIPCVVDGFITAAAALVAVRIQPKLKPWLLFSHMSREPGHSALLHALEVTPILSLGMRLGEASGAATILPLLKMACRLHAEMATFQEAQVSQA